MAVNAYPWGGEEWQDYCTVLLYLHHRGSYQPIPDADRGDRGLEGYSTDGKGCAYQCHAAKPHYGITERRTTQVKKIKDTVRTLIKNRDNITALVGDHMVQDLRFLFPLCESKELVEVVRQQERLLRDAAVEHDIPWLSQEVVISVHQGDELLVAEMAQLERIGAQHARLPDVTLSEDEVDQHLEQAASELTGANEKLRRRFGEQRVAALLRVVLEDHLKGQELEGHLAQHSPQIHEEYTRVVAERRQRIQRESIEGTTMKRTLTELGDELAKVISDSVAGLHTGDGQRLAEGTIADWLIECPLDFTGTEVGPS